MRQSVQLIGGTPISRRLVASRLRGEGISVTDTGGVRVHIGYGIRGEVQPGDIVFIDQTRPLRPFAEHLDALVIRLFFMGLTT